MKRLHVNFAPQRAMQALASMCPSHWLMTAMGIASGIAGLIASQGLTAQHQDVAAKLEQSQVSVNRKAVISEAQANAVNLIIQQLNLPWGRVMKAVERATPSSVALLELEPDVKRHLIKGHAEAKTASVMLTYLARLRQQPYLGNVMLARHEINDQDPNRPIRFEFEVEWAEAG